MTVNFLIKPQSKINKALAWGASVKPDTCALLFSTLLNNTLY